MLQTVTEKLKKPQIVRFEAFCSRSWARTSDPLINSRIQ